MYPVFACTVATTRTCKGGQLPCACGVVSVKRAELSVSRSHLHTLRHDVGVEVLGRRLTADVPAPATALRRGGVQLGLALRQLLFQILPSLRQPRIAVLRRQVPRIRMFCVRRLPARVVASLT